MISRIVVLLLISLMAGKLMACPDFSGDYEFTTEWNGRVLIEQDGCEEIKITKKNIRYGIDFTNSYLVDGKSYEGHFQTHNDRRAAQFFETDGPITDSTYSYHATFFSDDRLIIRFYHGRKSNCSEYTYTISECQISEYIYSLSNDNQTLTKEQVAFMRTANNYQTDRFSARRTR